MYTHLLSPVVLGAAYVYARRTGFCARTTTYIIIYAYYCNNVTDVRYINSQRTLYTASRVV